MCRLLVVFVTVCENVRGVIMLQWVQFFNGVNKISELLPDTWFQNPQKLLKQSHFAKRRSTVLLQQVHCAVFYLQCKMQIAVHRSVSCISLCWAGCRRHAGNSFYSHTTLRYSVCEVVKVNVLSMAGADTRTDGIT